MGMSQPFSSDGPFPGFPLRSHFPWLSSTKADWQNTRTLQCRSAKEKGRTTHRATAWQVTQKFPGVIPTTCLITAQGNLQPLWTPFFKSSSIAGSMIPEMIVSGLKHVKAILVQLMKLGLEPAPWWHLPGGQRRSTIDCWNPIVFLLNHGLCVYSVNPVVNHVDSLSFPAYPPTKINISQMSNPA